MTDDIHKKPLSLALGTFDGLHRGHMAVIEEALSMSSSGLTACVLLFNVHPAQVLKGRAPEKLITDSQRVKLLKDMGLESIVIDFARIQNLTAEEFVEKILIRELNAKALFCGYNYHFGKAASGTTEILKKICDSRGIKLSVSPAVTYEDEAISSTRIRQALLEGKIGDANAMLGRSFSFDFEVSHGKKLGRTINCPTINQSFPQGFLVPKHGVYFSKVFIEGSWLPALTNIGTRPTFEGKTQRSETFILGFCGDLYGKQVEVALFDYLRGEEKFEGLEGLTAQIKQDIEAAKKYFDI